jgi:hypothetical protein
MKKILLCLVLSIGLLALNVNMIMLCIVAFDWITLSIAGITAAGTIYIIYKGVYKLVYKPG